MKADGLYEAIDALPAASGIYRIWNEQTGDSYIGASRNIRLRCFHHFSRLSNGQASKALIEAFKPGHGSAAIEVLSLCTPDNLASEERRFIRQLKPSLNSHPHKQRVVSGEYISVAEAAKSKRCTRQAIHAAIKSGRLKAISETVTTTIWKVDAQSLSGLSINRNMQHGSGRPRRSGK